MIGHWGVVVEGGGGGVVEGGDGGCGGLGGEVGRAFAFQGCCCHFRGWSFVGRRLRVGRS